MEKDFLVSLSVPVAAFLTQSSKSRNASEHYRRRLFMAISPFGARSWGTTGKTGPTILVTAGPADTRLQNSTRNRKTPAGGQEEKTRARLRGSRPDFRRYAGPPTSWRPGNYQRLPTPPGEVECRKRCSECVGYLRGSRSPGSRCSFSVPVAPSFRHSPFNYEFGVLP